jgi:hypothetical protein
MADDPRPNKGTYKNVFEPVFIVENPEDHEGREPNVVLKEDTIFQVYRRAVVELIESGVSLDDAVAQIKPPDGVVDDDLRAKCAHIEAAMEAALLRSIQTAAMDKWQAAAWLLERRFGERWAKRPAVAKQDLFLASDPVYGGHGIASLLSDPDAEDEL